ncbi:hypothetical protein Efla_007026 [Eimeria flavescens]
MCGDGPWRQPALYRGPYTARWEGACRLLYVKQLELEKKLEEPAFAHLMSISGSTADWPFANTSTWVPPCPSQFSLRRHENMHLLGCAAEHPPSQATA